VPTEVDSLRELLVCNLHPVDRFFEKRTQHFECVPLERAVAWDGGRDVSQYAP
jgi:hypothetical protein